MIVLKRRTSGGLFDRLANEFEERWEQTTPLPTRERLHAYLAEVELEPWHEQNRDSELSTPPPATSAAPTALDPNAPRRWPRRPT